MKKTIIALSLTAVSSMAIAETCNQLNYLPGDVITVNSSEDLGTRIELPVNLSAAPMVTNAQHWDVLADEGDNQIVITPISSKKGGESTMIFAFVEDGKTFDIRADRVVTNKKNDSCVMVNGRKKLQRAKQLNAKQVKPKPMLVDVNLVESAHEKLVNLELKSKQKEIEVSTAKQQAISDYQQQIFTNYKWNQSGSFFGESVLSDIYDDGRQTFVRLNKPNERNIKIESVIDGQATEQLVNVVGENLISFDGVFSNFNLHLNDVKVSVTR